MTERDVVHLTAAHAYISKSTANMIAGVRDGVAALQPQIPQQGLLASRPAPAQTITKPSPPAPDSSSYVASSVLGIDVEQLFDMANLEVPNATYNLWTGSKSDLYSPSEDSFNFQSLGASTAVIPWDAHHIPDPIDYEELSGGAAIDRYITLYGKLPIFKNELPLIVTGTGETEQNFHGLHTL